MILWHDFGLEKWRLVLLMQVWARQRSSIYAYDCLNGFLISVIMSYLATDSGRNLINNSMKPMQIFRVTLDFIGMFSFSSCIAVNKYRWRVKFPPLFLCCFCMLWKVKRSKEMKLRAWILNLSCLEPRKWKFPPNWSWYN